MGLSEEETKAIQGLVREMVAASEEESGKAIGKLQVLFSAAHKNPRKYRPSAKYVAQQIMAQASGKPVAVHSGSFLVLTELVENGKSEAFP